MLGGIAVEKEIYACETAQICVCLHIGELIPLGESSYTSHYIFNSIKYFFLVHDYALLLTEYNTLMLNAKLHISCEITIEISMKFARPRFLAAYKASPETANIRADCFRAGSRHGGIRFF